MRAGRIAADLQRGRDFLERQPGGEPPRDRRLGRRQIEQLPQHVVLDIGIAFGIADEHRERRARHFPTALQPDGSAARSDRDCGRRTGASGRGREETRRVP